MSHDQAATSAAYILESPGGLKVRTIPWGATVTHLFAPDRTGRIDDVVLGFANDEDYRTKPHPYFGTMAGRVAGRITGAKFELNGHTYSLAANDPPNHLHGGVQGFDKQVWDAEQTSAQSVRFSRISPDGEEGYPGRVAVSVTYSVSSNADHTINVFSVDVEALTDTPTPFSLTHHSYFNLTGESSGESIQSHQLEIMADDYAPSDAHMGLLGSRVYVNDGNDFRKLRKLGDAIPNLHARHGDLYFLSQQLSKNNSRFAARLFHPGSGRVMNVSTNDPCIQLYTGMGFDGTVIGKSGKPYNAFAGLCLECERYPDAANSPHLGDIILYPHQKVRQRTVYAFSTF